MHKEPFLESVGKLEEYWHKNGFEFNQLSCVNYISLRNCYCNYRVVGSKGKAGGDGGDGGSGGVGGYAGKFVLIGLNKTPKLEHFNNTGNVYIKRRGHLLWLKTYF